jgi:hypothetical protein
MKDVLVNGSRMTTTDDVADALLHYTLQLTASHATEMVEFPALVDGRHSAVRMVVGAGVPLVTVTVELGLMPEIADSEFAAWEIRERTAQLLQGPEKRTVSD